MEKAYKVALEIILGMCKKESFINTQNLVLICETVLNEDTNGLNKAINEATRIANGGTKSV